MKIAKLFTQEVKIGLAGLLALCILIYGINYLKGMHIFNPSSYFYVKYKNINGLTKSSPVYADGFKVGVVHEIFYDYNNPGNVTVQVELDQDMRIPTGSTAELVVEMLGTVKMNLLLTDSPQSHLMGDTIPGVNNYGIMETVAALAPKVEGMLPKLDSILVSLNTLLGDENIPATIQSVRNISANLESTTYQLNTLMKRDLPGLTSKLNTVADNAIVLTDKLSRIDYAEMVRKVDKTIENARLLTEKLNSKDNSIGLLLNDKDLYNNLNATTHNAASLLEDLQTNPKRYVHFSIFGKKEKKE